MTTDFPTHPKLAAIRLPGSLARGWVGSLFMIEPKEEWRPIQGYEGIYEVSNRGRIKRLTVTVFHGHMGTLTRTGGIRKRHLNQSGYPVAALCRDGGLTWFSVHRLVAKAFIPNPENKPQVNHIDCNPKNNSVQNIEWVTSQENQRHAWNLDRFPDRHGEGAGNHKLTTEEVLEIRRRWPGVDLQRELAVEYGVCLGTIS